MRAPLCLVVEVAAATSTFSAQNFKSRWLGFTFFPRKNLPSFSWELTVRNRCWRHPIEVDTTCSNYNYTLHYSRVCLWMTDFSTIVTPYFWLIKEKTHSIFSPRRCSQFQDVFLVLIISSCHRTGGWVCQDAGFLEIRYLHLRGTICAPTGHLTSSSWRE